jgi:hypothetical protein
MREPSLLVLFDELEAQSAFRVDASWSIVIDRKFDFNNNLTFQVCRLIVVRDAP